MAVYEGFTIYGPYTRNDGRQHIVLGRTDGVSSSELKAKIAIKIKNN